MNILELSKAGINVSEGVKRFNGNNEMYEKFLNKFLYDTNYKAVCDSIESKDAKAAFAAAHALKGIAGNLSMNRLFDNMLPLVEKLREGSLEDADKLLESVTQAYQEIIAALEEED